MIITFSSISFPSLATFYEGREEIQTNLNNIDSFSSDSETTPNWHEDPFMYNGEYLIIFDKTDSLISSSIPSHLTVIDLPEDASFE